MSPLALEMAKMAGERSPLAATIDSADNEEGLSTSSGIVLPVNFNRFVLKSTTA